LKSFTPVVNRSFSKGVIILKINGISPSLLIEIRKLDYASYQEAFAAVSESIGHRNFSLKTVKK
jgi:hypothetical protein